MAGDAARSASSSRRLRPEGLSPLNSRMIRRADCRLCATGSPIKGPFQHHPRPFDAHLRQVLSAYRLGRLFRDDGPGQHHHQIRPAGYDYREDVVCALGMELWRADYRAMEPVRQIMAATAIWLYRGGADSRWLRRVPCVWSASEALQELERAGSLEDWLKLVVLYPGW